MENLLQQLWDEYKMLVDMINKATDDTELTPKMQDLNDSINDTPEMKVLRENLINAGVKL